MAAPGMYLISVSICVGILYLVYVAVFRFNTFFALNRYYLLGSLLFAFIVPALDLPLRENEYQTLIADHISSALHPSEEEFILSEPMLLSKKTPRFLPVLSILYYVGVVVMLLRIAYSIRHLARIRNRAERSNSGNVTVFRTDGAHPFSFFNCIFLPKYAVSPLIIEHEKVHVRQYHSIDLIIVEMATVLLWFNPIMFFFKRSVKAQHEYLADAGTILGGVRIQDYLNVLLHQIRVESAIGPISQFYSKSIKNRIMMITKNKTSIRFSGVYLLLIPVFSLLLFAFADKPSTISIVNQSSLAAAKGFAIIVDPGHGGSDFGATSASGLAEKKLTLAIAKKMEQFGRKQGIKVILTRANDENLTLEERTSFSDRFPAKVFISLHINDDDADATKSGIDCIISERNAGFEQSRKFSDHLVNELKTIERISVNGIMNSNFYILKNNSIPAIALELGYFSNENDSRFLGNEENQRVLAETIINAALKYL